MAASQGQASTAERAGSSRPRRRDRRADPRDAVSTMQSRQRRIANCGAARADAARRVGCGWRSGCRCWQWRWSLRSMMRRQQICARTSEWTRPRLEIAKRRAAPWPIAEPRSAAECVVNAVRAAARATSSTIPTGKRLWISPTHGAADLAGVRARRRAVLRVFAAGAARGAPRRREGDGGAWALGPAMDGERARVDCPDSSLRKSTACWRLSSCARTASLMHAFASNWCRRLPGI